MTNPTQDLSSPPPPDSWPGAHGRRSVAPDVPAWPGAVVRADGGDSWPGAQGRGGDSVAATRPTAVAAAESGSGGVAGILFPAVAVVVALILVGVWAALDAGNRSLQIVLFAVVMLAALGGLGISLYRHRGSL